jgi:DNA-binding response OmpR family regulator
MEKALELEDDPTQQQMPTVGMSLKSADTPSPIGIGNLIVFGNGMVLSKGDCIARLSRTQVVILKTLYYSGTAVPVNDLLNTVKKNGGNCTAKSLHVLMYRLRRNLEQDAGIRIDLLPGGYLLIQETPVNVSTQQEHWSITYNDITLVAGQLIKADGTTVILSETDYNMLKIFFHKPQQLIPLYELISSLEDAGIYMGYRVVITNMYRIRKYLTPMKIQITAKRDGKGYMLTDCPHAKRIA